MDRLQAEQQFHDAQAAQRAVTFHAQPQLLHVDDTEYLDHETWIRPALASLGDVAGLRVLEYGCGHGMASVVLARQGAQVVGFDVSLGYLRESAWRAEVNRVSVQLAQVDGHRLPFAAHSFDRVWGNAVLHHLALPQAAAELRRVLKPDGWAVFCEPWGGNPLLRWARQALPYRGKEHTRDERPFESRDLTVLREHFSQVEVQGYQLLSMCRRALPYPSWAKPLAWCDRHLLRLSPRLQRFCRYVVLTLRP